MKLVERPAADSAHTAGKQIKWDVVTRAFTYKRLICVSSVDSLH